MESPEELARVLGTAVSAGWPSDDLKDAIPVYIAHLDRDPTALGWGLWFMIDPATTTMVGDAGFKGRPDALGRVEVGYGVAPAERRKGYATEAVEALVEWAATRSVKIVAAECLDHNIASIRVLEKAGFERKSQLGSMLKWERKVTA
jgi:ribosomal-protein-alanine N-acetyltransferase